MRNMQQVKSMLSKLKKKFGTERSSLLDYLTQIQYINNFISIEYRDELAALFKIAKIEIEQVVSFYHFLSFDYRGKFAIYLDQSITSEMAGLKEVELAFLQQLKLANINSVTEDKIFGLFSTSCIGMSDQAPAAMINNYVFASLNTTKVKAIIAGLNNGQSLASLHKDHGKIKNQVQKKGAVIFARRYQLGDALEKALALTPQQIIQQIKKSSLRGRGGAGFPTGLKWELCAKNPGPSYVFANIDEGEPGTFKDRVLLKHCLEQIIEGMTIAALAVSAEVGFIYLRGEYQYYLPVIEKKIKQLTQLNLLGENILNSARNFTLKVKLGAGAYICGEESALLESSEGKRGEPRNRPPFPVEKGYLGQPTIVNNPETFASVSAIFDLGADWFLSLGTDKSKGVKLLSVSGDCELPGVYELEFGVTLKELLKLVKAKDTAAVQVGGPSGQMVAPADFDKKIAFEDLSTGGAICIYSSQRDLLHVVANYMQFFVDESCGFCVPCRAGNVILNKTLQKINDGFGVKKDLELMRECGQMVINTSRCGLGQSSPHPILTSLKAFPQLYLDKINTDSDFVSQFDMSVALADSPQTKGRKKIW